MYYCERRSTRLGFLSLAFLASTAAVVGRAQDKPSVYVRHVEQAYYPPLAAQARIQGTVKLKLMISAAGKVMNVVPLSNDEAPKAHPLLEMNSVATVRTWTFGCFNCAAGTDYEHVITFVYKLDGSPKSQPLGTTVMDLPNEVTIISPPILCDHCPSPAPALSFIAPGSSIGLIRLGATQEDVERVSPLRVTKEYSDSSPDCKPRTEMSWAELEGDGYISAFLRDGAVFQIESATRRYSTSEGVTVNTSPSRLEKLKKQFGWLEAYVLDPSGGQEFDLHDFNYWVSREKGIAFELAYSPKSHRQFVRKVIVFAPGTEFFPEGCIAPTQRWFAAPAYTFFDK